MSNSSPAILLPSIQLQLLGEFDLFVEQERRTGLLTYDKPRLLLAILALAQGDFISRHHLANMLWPTLTETQGKTRFRHALHVLRQALGSHHAALQTRDDRLAISPDDFQIDVMALLADSPNNLDDEMCLTLYKGPLLNDLRARIDGPMEEWLQHWDQRLNTKMTQRRQRLISNWTACGQVRLALAHARQWLQRWPNEDSCHRILIDLLVRDERHDEARDVYEQYANALRVNADAQPDMHMQALIANLPLPNSSPATSETRHKPPHYRPLAVLVVTLRGHAESATSLLQTDLLEWLRSVSATIRRNARLYGGWLAPTGGNQFIIYFGYPSLSERPVLRAVDLARTLRELPLPGLLSIHMGVHADISLCDDSRPDYGNLLAQTALMLSAQGNWSEILLSAQAQERMTEYEVLEVRRHGKTIRLLGHNRAPTLQKAIGRTVELNTLLHALRRCNTEGGNQALSIVGAPGLGKSLLAVNLAHHANQMGADVVWLQCLQDQQAIVLHPLRLWLMARLPATLDAVTDEMLSTALGLPISMCGPLTALFRTDGPLHNQTTTGPDTLELASRAIMSPWHPDRPLLIVFEDIQWADTVTVEWLTLLANRPLQRPVMLLTTSATPMASNITPELHLQPLDEKACLDVVSQRARQLKLDKLALAEIAKLGNGNPLHLTAIMAEIAARKTQESSGSSNSTRLPTATTRPSRYLNASYRPCHLVDKVCAQLAQLDEETRKLAYLCALLDAPLTETDATGMMLCGTQTLHQRLNTLQSSGILSQDDDRAWYCPALVVNVIRDQLDATTCEQLNKEIAQYLLNTEAPRTRVAHFLEQARDPRAPLWWKDAATAALKANQLRDADELIARALSRLELLPSDAERDQFVFECQMLKSTISTTLSGPVHPDTAASYFSATPTSAPGDLGAMIVSLWGQWIVAQNAGNYVDALRLAQQLTHVANTVQDLNFQGWAVYALAQHHLWRGAGREAQSLLTHAETMLSNAPAMESSPFGVNAQALIPASLAVAYGLQGKYTQAFAAVERAIQMSMVEDSNWITILCRLSCARIHYLKGELDHARQQGEHVLELVAEITTPTPWQAIATGYTMLPKVLSQRDPEALAAMEAALPAIRYGMPVSVDGHLCLLARACIAMNDIPKAMALLDEAQALGASHGSCSLTPEIYCLRGDAWQELGDIERAQMHWQHAHAEAQASALAPYEHWANTRLHALEPHA